MERGSRKKGEQKLSEDNFIQKPQNICYYGAERGEKTSNKNCHLVQPSASTRVTVECSWCRNAKAVEKLPIRALLSLEAGLEASLRGFTHNAALDRLGWPEVLENRTIGGDLGSASFLVGQQVAECLELFW